MPRSLLSSLNFSLQIQLFLSSLFRLQRYLEKIDHSKLAAELIKPASDVFPWKEDHGILNRLKMQIHFLSQASKEPILQELSQILEQAIQNCSESSIEPDRIFAVFVKTGEFLHACPPDENLYFFLLRHQEDCKRTFGRVFLLNFFKKKHQGLKQTEQFLINKYQERGFFDLKTSIRTHFEGLTK